MTDDPDEIVTDPAGRYTRANLLPLTDFNKKVYRAYDDETAVEVAWVEYNNLPPSLLTTLEEYTKLLVQLNHPNILKYHKGWSDAKNKRFTFVTEITSSGSLKKFLWRKVHMKANVMRSWCGQILDGLNYLHTHSPPMWHRALRCETVFISGNVSVVKIGALETAQLLEHFAPAELHVAPEFDAPELTTESAPAPDKVDVYAFGMTVLQMFTYDYPYSECHTPGQIWLRTTRGELPASLRKLRRPIVAEFIESCLRPPSKRPTTHELREHAFFSQDFEQSESLLHENALLPEAERGVSRAAAAAAAAPSEPTPSTDPAPTSSNASSAATSGASGTTSASSTMTSNVGAASTSAAAVVVAAASVPATTTMTTTTTTTTAAVVMPSTGTQASADAGKRVLTVLAAKPGTSRTGSAAPATVTTAPSTTTTTTTGSAAIAEQAEAQTAPRRYIKCYFDAASERGTGTSAECIRLALDSVTSVSQLKLRLIRDFSLPLVSEPETDDASGDSLESLATAVPKVKLKYRDRDGDYVTVLERTEMSELLEFAIALHVSVSAPAKPPSRRRLVDL